MIQVNKRAVVDALATVRKNRIFPGFAMIPGTSGPTAIPPSDYADMFVTVSPDGTPANLVTITYTIDFAALATRASTLTQPGKAAGNALPAITVAATMPTPGTVLNGVQVVAEQLDQTLQTDFGSEDLKLLIQAIPVPRDKVPETYEVTAFVDAQFLLTDRAPEPFGGEDDDELSQLDFSLLAANKPNRDVFAHPKGKIPLERRLLPLAVNGLEVRDPFLVELGLVAQATTDGGGDGPSVSSVRITGITVNIRAVPKSGSGSGDAD